MGIRVLWYDGVKVFASGVWDRIFFVGMCGGSVCMVCVCGYVGVWVFVCVGMLVCRYLRVVLGDRVFFVGMRACWCVCRVCLWVC